MSSLKTYTVMMFTVLVVLRICGFVSPFEEAYVNANNFATQTDAAQTLLNAFLAAFTNPIFLGILGVSAIASVFTSGTNFSVTYLLPILFVQVVLNLFVFPTTTLVTLSVDPIIQLMIGGFFNLLLVMSLLEFVRGM